MVKIEESPTVDDSILFELNTITESMNSHDPEQLDYVKIYFVEYGKAKRSYKDTQSFSNEKCSQELKSCRDKVLDRPNVSNINELIVAKEKALASKFTLELKNKGFELVHAADVKDVKKVGYSFEYFWDAKGSKEGNYLLEFGWKNNGRKHRGRQRFYLNSGKDAKTFLQMRHTPVDKYEMLLAKYTPRMYKRKIKTNDLTPEVITKLNSVVADGLTALEEMACQLITILDANVAHKNILPLLAKSLGVTLYSANPTLWRAQIKKAVPIYKHKGTLIGLKNALKFAGINLLKLTNLWQIQSQYYRQDGFVVKNTTDAVLGTLSACPLDISTYQLFMKNDGKFVEVPGDMIDLIPPMEKTDQPMVVWRGAVDLFENDVVLIRYCTKECPKNKQSIENYLYHLPLMDKRNEVEQVYPPKDWNTRLIEEDDPMFRALVPERHPFIDPVMFGMIRTTFLYSENIYNMDTYNGSLRGSTQPCDIDKNFVEPCGACLSSYFNVDLEISDLSDERINEAMEIIEENKPFHSVVHSVNLNGMVSDYILPPVETIECDVQNKPKPKENVGVKESISYEIEYADGTKKKVIT